MKEFIAAAVQIAVRPNDIKHNIQKVCHYMERAAAEHGAGLVVFPESVTTGFAPNMPFDDFYKLLDTVPGTTIDNICEAAGKIGVHVVLPMYERDRYERIIYNSSVLIDDSGEILGIYRKTHPFPTERKEGGGWTTPGRDTPVIDTRLGRIGMILCYDGDFPELSRVLALKGAEIITRPSAFLRSYDIWELTNLARAYDNHVYMIGVNAVGPDAAENYYFGGSMIISPIAQKLAQARGCEEIVSAVLSSDPLRYVTYGTRSPMIFDHLEDRNVGVYGEILSEGKSSFEPDRRVPYKR
jgi:predicted amidohydrolase